MLLRTSNQSALFKCSIVRQIKNLFMTLAPNVLYLWKKIKICRSTDACFWFASRGEKFSSFTVFGLSETQHENNNSDVTSCG